MLKFLRNQKTKKWIMGGMACLLVVGFFVSIVMVSKDDKKSASALAKFEKRRISVQEYLNNYRAVQRQASLMYGDKLNELRSRIDFKSEAWDHLLLLEYAKKHNIKATDAEVVEWITKQQGFQKDGKFDDTFYKMYVERALRSTPRDFEEETRQMLTIGKVQDRIRQELKLTDEKLKELYKEEHSEKDVVYGFLPSEPLESQVTVTDADVKQVYDVVKEQLTTPETAKLRYVIAPKEMTEDTEMSLDDFAKKHALEVKETSFFSRADRVNELVDYPQLLAFAFTGTVGDTSIWFDAASGRARATLAERQEPHPMTLDEAKEEVKKVFRRDKARELAVEKMKTIAAKIQNPADFETVLKAEGLSVEKIEKFKKDTYPAGIYPSENLYKAVEKLGKDGVSAPFDVPKGAMIAKVTDVHVADGSKFETEKKDFRERMESQKGREEMDKILREMRGKLSLNPELMKDLFPAD